MIWVTTTKKSQDNFKMKVFPANCWNRTLKCNAQHEFMDIKTSQSPTICSDRNLIDLGFVLFHWGSHSKETTSIFSTYFNRVSGVSQHMWHPFEDLEKLSAMVGEAGPRADGENTFGVIGPGTPFFSDLINEYVFFLFKALISQWSYSTLLITRRVVPGLSHDDVTSESRFVWAIVPWKGWRWHEHGPRNEKGT